MTDDREPFREPRAAWKAKHHEQRLENATYTAAEVKVLTEDACKVAAEAGRRIGRREAGDEIAQAILAATSRYSEWQQRDVVYDMERLAREYAKGDPGA